VKVLDKFQAFILFRLQFDLLHTFPAHMLQLGNQRLRLVQLCDVVTTANAPSVHEHIRNCSSAGHLGQFGLQTPPKGVLVEFYDVGGGDYRVPFEKDVFGAAGMRAEGFGEYND
jgi:hypothetical protein